MTPFARRGFFIGRNPPFFPTMKCKLFFFLLFFRPSYAQERILFASGELGYECFRIPALVQWESGELYAFKEVRKSNCLDFANIDILMRGVWPAARLYHR
jgi:hypothetical protein